MHKFVRSPLPLTPHVWSHLNMTVSGETGNFYIYNECSGQMVAALQRDERPFSGIMTYWHSVRMMLKVRLNSTYGNNIEIEKNRVTEIYAEMRKLNAIVRHIEETGGLSL